MLCWWEKVIAPLCGCCCIPVCLPVPYINQPKVHVSNEGFYVIVTGSICVNRMTRQWEGSNVKML